MTEVLVVLMVLTPVLLMLLFAATAGED